MKKVLGIMCIIMSVLIVAYVLYINLGYHSLHRPFSSYTILSSSWDIYKKKFINKDGRVIDYSQGDITTSEAQAYAMLRSVWIDDKPTFDLTWTWTKNVLNRPKDNLFGWRWGKNTNGKYGFITGGGDNSATDADEDIALALIFAGNRWHDSTYIDAAKKILPDIWTIETATAHGQRYVTAGNWAENQTTLVLNPSYFAPYAWRIFASVDEKHDWMSLINPSYALLSQVSSSPLDKQKSVGLPPDWVSIDRKSGMVSSAAESNLTTAYSFDAVRIPWRIALDYRWNNEKQAFDYLRSSFSFLVNEYQKTDKLAATYSHDGMPLVTYEDPIIYSTSLSFLIYVDPSLAKKMYQEKIISLYANDTNSFNSNLSYYEQNWLWFGAAFYNNALIPYK